MDGSCPWWQQPRAAWLRAAGAPGQLQRCGAGRPQGPHSRPAARGLKFLLLRAKGSLVSFLQSSHPPGTSGSHGGEGALGAPTAAPPAQPAASPPGTETWQGGDSGEETAAGGDPGDRRMRAQDGLAPNPVRPMRPGRGCGARHGPAPQGHGPDNSLPAALGGGTGGLAGQDERFKGHFVVETRGGSACQGQASRRGEVCKQGQQVWLQTGQQGLGKVAARREVRRRTHVPSCKAQTPQKHHRPAGSEPASLLLQHQGHSCLLRAPAGCCPQLGGPTAGSKRATHGGGRQPAPQETPQPTPRRIRLVLNQERHVASGGAARNRQQPSNEEHPKNHPKIRTSKASVKPREGLPLLHPPLPGSLPAPVTVAPQKMSAGRRAGLGTCCCRRGRPCPASRSEQGHNGQGGRSPGSLRPHTPYNQCGSSPQGRRETLIPQGSQPP